MANKSAAENKARELSAELYGVFPDLRDGRLPVSESSGSDDSDARSAIRELLIGASLVATKQAVANGPLPDELMDYKRMVGVMACLEPGHQLLLYKVYWDGKLTPEEKEEVDEATKAAEAARRTLEDTEMKRRALSGPRYKSKEEFADYANKLRSKTSQDKELMAKVSEVRGPNLVGLQKKGEKTVLI